MNAALNAIGGVAADQREETNAGRRRPRVLLSASMPLSRSSVPVISCIVFTGSPSTLSLKPRREVLSNSLLPSACEVDVRS